MCHDSYPTTYHPPFKKYKSFARAMKRLKMQKNKSHLCRDASVPSVPQTNTRGRLHLIRGSPRRLVTLPIRPHLQILMDDIWIRERKKSRERKGGWEVEFDGWRRSVENRAGLNPSWWLKQERKTISWILLRAPLFLQAPGCVEQRIYTRSISGLISLTDGLNVFNCHRALKDKSIHHTVISPCLNKLWFHT